jgi:DNA polymerase III gamma/tau subunit
MLFLKTLEEPPNMLFFYFSNYRKHKIIPTILSCCQILILKELEDAKDHLAEVANSQGVVLKTILYIIAQKMQCVLSIFDRVVLLKNLTRRQAVTENL